MTTLTRFVPFRSPFQDMSVLQNRLNSIFSDFNRTGSEDELTTGSFIPPVDVYENQHKLVLKLEVPGIKQDDLQINLENQTLTIRGERKFESDEKEENFHRVERRYGSFVRSFTLPQTVDTNNVTANCDAGVLTIEMTKKAEAKPKQVKIGVGGAKQVEGAKSESKQVESKTAA